MFSKIKVALLTFLMCCSVLVVTSNAYAANTVTVKANGAKSIHADAAHLKILNKLYGSKVTYKQVIEQVYPEAIDGIPATTLKNMDKTLVNWSSGYETPTSPSSTNQTTNISNSVSPNYSGMIATAGSQISGNRSLISYGGDTTIIFPPYGTVPYMCVLTYLYAGSPRGNIDSSFDEDYGVSVVNCYGSVFSPGAGNYQAKSSHMVEWADGTWWASNSASSILRL